MTNRKVVTVTMGVVLAAASAGIMMMTPMASNEGGFLTPVVAKAAVNPKTDPIADWLPSEQLQQVMVEIANQENQSNNRGWPTITTSNLGQYADQITGEGTDFSEANQTGTWGRDVSAAQSLQGMQYFTHLEYLGLYTDNPTQTFSDTSVKFANSLTDVTIVGPGSADAEGNLTHVVSRVKLEDILSMFSESPLFQITVAGLPFESTQHFPDLTHWKDSLALVDFSVDNLNYKLPDLSYLTQLQQLYIQSNSLGFQAGANRLSKLPPNLQTFRYQDNYFGSGMEQTSTLTDTYGANQINTAGENGDGGVDGYGKVFELDADHKSFFPIAISLGGMGSVSSPSTYDSNDPFVLTDVNGAGAKIVKVSDAASGTDYFRTLDLNAATDVTNLFDITYDSSDVTAANPSGLKLTVKDFSQLPEQGTYAIKVQNKNATDTNNYSSLAFMRVAKKSATVTPGNSTTPIVQTPTGGGGTGTTTPVTNQPHTVPTPTGQTGLGVTTTVGGQEVAAKGQAVYALKGIYMYKSKNFTATARRAHYAKARRVNRPMFVVTGYARSKSGALRYIVRDVNHKRHTDGWRGYITANAKYVVPVYYASLPKSRVITVINKTGVNAYNKVNLTSKAHHYRKGAHLKVVKIVRYHLTTRYVLSNGDYVTANKKLVIAGNY